MPFHAIMNNFPEEFRHESFFQTLKSFGVLDDLETARTQPEKEYFQALIMLHETDLLSPEVSRFLRYCGTDAEAWAEFINFNHESCKTVNVFGDDDLSFQGYTPWKDLSLSGQQEVIRQTHNFCTRLPKSHHSLRHFSAFVSAGEDCALMLDALVSLINFRSNIATTPVIEALLASKKHMSATARAIQHLYDIEHKSPRKELLDFVARFKPHIEEAAIILQKASEAWILTPDFQASMANLSSEHLPIIAQIFSDLQSKDYSALTARAAHIIIHDSIARRIITQIVHYDRQATFFFNTNNLSALSQNPQKEAIAATISELLRAAPHLATRQNLELLFHSNNPAQDFLKIKTDELEKIAGHRIGLPVDDPQSSHNATIHATSSESAERLKIRYAKRINESKTLEDIKHWALRGTEHHKVFSPHKTVADALTDIIKHISTNDGIDPTSKVLLKDLLLLSWTACHDPEFVEDQIAAEKAFREGLLDMVRYRFDGSLNSICFGGKFNKLIERLVGTHPDAEQVVQTSGYAAAKLPIYIRNEFEKFLETHPNKETIEKIRKNGIAEIWSELEPGVKSQMRYDFDRLFENDEKGLSELVQYGQEISFSQMRIDPETLQKKPLILSQTQSAQRAQEVDPSLDSKSGKTSQS